MIKNIEAYHMVMDYLTHNETWNDEEVPYNLRDECLAHSSEATWVWGEDNTLDSATAQLDTMEEHYGTYANFVALEHDDTWLAVSTLETSAMYISTICQYMEREKNWENERAAYIDQIELLYKQLNTLKEKEQ